MNSYLGVGVASFMNCHTNLITIPNVPSASPEYPGYDWEALYSSYHENEELALWNKLFGGNK